MTKEKIIELYINDLESKVSASPARDSRIQMLKEELSQALNIASVDSRRELLPKPIEAFDKAQELSKGDFIDWWLAQKV